MYLFCSISGLANKSWTKYIFHCTLKHSKLSSTWKWIDLLNIPSSSSKSSWFIRENNKASVEKLMERKKRKKKICLRIQHGQKKNSMNSISNWWFLFILTTCVQKENFTRKPAMTEMTQNCKQEGWAPSVLYHIRPTKVQSQHFPYQPECFETTISSYIQLKHSLRYIQLKHSLRNHGMTLETNQSNSSVFNSGGYSIAINFVQRNYCHSSSKFTILKKLFSGVFCVYYDIEQLSTSSNLQTINLLVYRISCITVLQKGS